MKTLMSRKLIQKMSVLGTLLMVTLYIGHGCSEFNANTEMGSSSTNLGTVGNVGSGSGFTPLPNAKTVSLLYNKQLLDNMIVCTGIGTASVNSKDEWDRRQSSFSEYGYATDVTAPMLMAVAAVSGEVCNDLLRIETALPADSRRIFNAINFGAGPASLTSAQVAETAKRIARSCWAREEASDELTIIQEEVTAGLAGVNMSDAGQTRRIALMMCTGMIASLSGLSF